MRIILNKKVLKKETNSYINIVIVCILALFTLLPSKILFEYIKLGIVFVITFFYVMNNKDVIKVDKISVSLIWLINTILAVFMVLLVEHTVNEGVVFHEIARLIYYSLIIILCDSITVHFDVLLWICRVLLLFHFIFQTLQYLKIGNTYDFLYNYYLDDKTQTAHLDMAYYDNFRSGSIYLNPNVFVIYPVVFLLVFLENTNGKFNILDYVFIIIAAISMYYTGSRTGLILFVLVFLIFVFINRKNNKLSWVVKIVIPILLLVGLFILMRLQSRILTIDNGLDESIGTKMEGLWWYIDECSPWYYLFGSLGSSFRIPIDMEFGYIFSWWGLFGYFWYFRLIYFMGINNSKNYKFLERGTQLAIIFSSFSCSVILNMSVFPFVCVITFTHLLSNKNIVENEK